MTKKGNGLKVSIKLLLIVLLEGPLLEDLEKGINYGC
jgi:hypothetical protein